MSKKMKKYKFTSSRICYEDMEAIIKADSYKEALQIAEDDRWAENHWKPIGIGDCKNIECDNINCEDEKGEAI